MFHWFGNCTKTNGDALPGWFVECVLLSDMTTPVATFADESGTPIATLSGVTNRAKADAEGNYDFFVNDGIYGLRFYDENTVFIKTQRYLPMYGADWLATAGFIQSGANGPAIATAVATYQQATLLTGAYANTNTAITFPFGKTVKFYSGAVLTNSGTGTATYDGVAIRDGYNPGALTGWTHTTAPYSYEGVSVELGGYGPRQFGAFGTPTAINGSIKIPAAATIANHANGVSGYVKNASITTGGVALYGEANRDAASALIWGINTRSQDFGFGGLNVWGYEMDMNIDNVTTTAIGFDAVGGSTVEPTSSIAYQVQAIGIFTSPKKRWQYGFRSRDAGALIGMELGAQTDTATSPSQIFQMNYRNAANAPVTGFVAQVDSAGNALLTGGIGTTLFSLRTPTSSTNQIQLLANALGFYGASPVNKQTVSAAATDPATTQTLANSLRTLIINLGLAA